MNYKLKKHVYTYTDTLTISRSRECGLIDISLNFYMQIGIGRINGNFQNLGTLNIVL